MIHSVSYEHGQKDSETPTLKDGHNWLDILRQGLTIKMEWPQEYIFELKSIKNLLRHPHNTLPSFNRDSFSKLESTMQENLFKILSSSWNSMVDSSLPQLDFQFKEIGEVSLILVLPAYFGLHVYSNGITDVLVSIYNLTRCF